MTADCGVRRSPKATTSLRRLPKAVRDVADKLALRLGALVRSYPERVYGTASDRRVYQHPDPLIEIEFIEAENHFYRVMEFRAPLPPRVLVFISYSHRDDEFRAELCKYLGRLHETGQVSFWRDKNDITPGTEWAKAIRSAITRSSAALLLVTQEFIHSKFIRDSEIPAIEARVKAQALQLFWIPIDSTTIKIDLPWISEHQNFNIETPLSLLTDALRKNELSRFCTEFRLHLETLATVSKSTKSRS